MKSVLIFNKGGGAEILRSWQNFQSDRMILGIFIGLERSMLDFFGKNHHLGIFFQLR
jgi:hypothetical protein